MYAPTKGVVHYSYVDFLRKLLEKEPSTDRIEEFWLNIDPPGFHGSRWLLEQSQVDLFCLYLAGLELENSHLQMWKKELAAGNAAAGAAIIPLLLPQLRYLDLSGAKWDAYWFHSAIQLHGFKHLEKLDISVINTDYTTLVLFFALPSLRKVIIYGLEEPRDIEAWEGAFANIRSKVQKILLPECCISLRTLQSLIGCCNDLRKLSVDGPRHATQKDHVLHFNGPSLMDSLLKAKNSLKKLEMHAYMEGEEVASLRRLSTFPNLRTTLCSGGAVLDAFETNAGFDCFLAPQQAKVYLYHLDESLLHRLVRAHGPLSMLLDAHRTGESRKHRLDEIRLFMEDDLAPFEGDREVIRVLAGDLKDHGVYLKIVGHGFCSDSSDEVVDEESSQCSIHSHPMEDYSDFEIDHDCSQSTSNPPMTSVDDSSQIKPNSCLGSAICTPSTSPIQREILLESQSTLGKAGVKRARSLSTSTVNHPRQKSVKLAGGSGNRSPKDNDDDQIDILCTAVST